MADDELGLPPETGDLGTAPQEPAPASEAAQKEVESVSKEKTPEVGDTPSPSPEKEPMIPKSRLDEESGKRQKLEAEVKELRLVAERLERLGSRFGRKSDAYLEELEKFYDQQDRVRRLQEKGIQPGTTEAKLAELEEKVAKQEEEAAMRPYLQQIQREFEEVKANPKFALFTKNWEKWQKVFSEAMRTEPNKTASDVAQDYLDLLNSEKEAYIKTKTDEGKRVIEGAGGSGPVSKTAKQPARIKDFDQVIQEGARLYAGS